MTLNVLSIEANVDGQPTILNPVWMRHANRNYLVDCGYEETFDELKRALAKLNMRIEDLTAVIITHDDIDHLGGLKRLKEINPDLKIYCGEHEADAVSGKVKSERLMQAESSLAHLPEAHIPWAQNFIKRLEAIERFEVHKVFADNEAFEKDIEVIHTPGHTKGHISLFHTRERILIAGDAMVVEEGSFNIANPAFTLDMAAALRSVERIKNLNPQKIICYHGGVLEKNIQQELQALIERYSHYLGDQDQ